MEVYLAGYNVDAGAMEGENLTPETISAAYARISRDPRPVNVLRDIARGEVDRARKSNEAIIFGMGHSSIAEHAVFNFDIIGLSRLGMEALEHFRLASYTEKSQRYITLEDDYIIPQEIQDQDDINKFKEIITLQNEFYHKLYVELKEYVFTKNKALAENPKNKALLEGWAKEDARYITSLATEGQLGLTVNARTLELMIRRFAASDLLEIRALGKKLYEAAKNIAPSVVKYTDPTPYEEETYNDLKEAAAKYVEEERREKKENGYPEPTALSMTEQGDADGDEAGDVKLIKYSEGSDDFLVGALIHTSSALSFDEALNTAKKMTLAEKKELIQKSAEHIKLFNPMLREFEYPEFVFEISLSAACFGQLKRHRLATITTQEYDIDLGVTIPESITKVGLEAEFKEIINKTNETYTLLFKKYPKVAHYILTNSHRRRLLIKMNARSLYHLSRLREDAHAQWDIRNITKLMITKAKKIAPLTFFLVGGKDKFEEIYNTIYCN